MLTDDEILNSVNAAPLAQGPQSFVLAIGRAIEAKVLEKARAQVAGLDCAHRCGVGHEVADKLRAGARKA
jgi:hypothetical protein